MKHTPTPWTLEGRNILGAAHDGSMRCIAPVSGQSPANADANAAHIVRCVNAHDALVESLSGLIEWMEQHHPTAASNISKARAALALAKVQS